MCFRCEWLDTTKADYVAYHDTQWGVPLFDDNALFEFLTLESAQAGLSWYTVLKKRDNYYQAYANFEPAKIVLFTEQDIERLMQDTGIVRNKLKVNSSEFVYIYLREYRLSKTDLTPYTPYRYSELTCSTGSIKKWLIIALLQLLITDS